ncbi:MAG: 5-formyltetrahydrofolate cyclo-ligase [Betaproteobacteria bacterium]|nr:5-formyltetrahydrofolate cyclo-ligase [Betaproteobacteria bacterium]
MQTSDKKTLRSELRRARGALGPRQRRAAALKVARLAARLHLLRHDRRIGFYIPSKGEIDILPLMNRALAVGAPCYLPKLPLRSLKRLWFTRLGNHAHHWRLNRFGIPEYDDGQAKRLRAQQLDLIFVPLLGFDDAGYRLGMGGGFYDTSLAYLRRRRQWRRPKLIGVAFDCQHVARVPHDPWDVPLDLAVTEKRIYRF